MARTSKVSNGGTRGHNSFMFVTDVCCHENEIYNSRETAIVGDLPNPANIDGDLLARKIRKPVPVAVYPFPLSSPSPFFARNAFISSFMVHRRVFFCRATILSKMHKLEIYWFSALNRDERR